MALQIDPTVHEAELPGVPYDLDLTADGSLLACATVPYHGGEGLVCVLRTADGSVVSQFQRLSYSSGYGVAFVGGDRDLVYLVELESGARVLYRVGLEHRDPEELRSYGVSARVSGIVRDPAARRFAVLGNRVEIWDAETNEVLRVLEAERWAELRAAFSADGERIYVSGIVEDAVVRYDVVTGEKTGQWAAPRQRSGRQVVLTPDERFLAIVGIKGVCLYDLTTGEQVLNHAERVTGPWGAAPDSSLLLSLQRRLHTVQLPGVVESVGDTWVTEPGVDTIAACAATGAPIFAFGTRDDSRVRWFTGTTGAVPPAETMAARVFGTHDGIVPDAVRELIDDARRSGATTLDLSHRGLATLPESIGELTALTELRLNHNQLRTLPDSLGRLTGLTTLVLSDNELTSVPEALGALKSLDWLDLSYNHLTTVPESIGQLTEMTALELQANQITSLPDALRRLTGLAALNLFNNQLTEVPGCVAGLTGLTELELGGNHLTEIPEFIGRLTVLTNLGLCENQLANLPDALGELTALAGLNLQGNQLTDLPKTLSRLAASLADLDLWGNRLTEVPAVVSSLTALTSLNLRQNQLTVIPDFLRRLPLTRLDLSENPLGTPPAWLAELPPNVVSLG